MLIQTLQTLFRRDLEKLKLEIESFQNEANIWKVDKNILNSAGNLCLHLVGNLNMFIGNQLGGTDYVRDRAAEFSTKDVSRTELVKMVEETILVVEQSLNKISTDQLQAHYPIDVFEDKMTTEYFLVHLATHLGYHLGQINYHRRMLDETLSVHSVAAQ